MRSPIRRPGGPRRGVTLVEMLVVVALVVLMMTILVQIFSGRQYISSTQANPFANNVNIQPITITSQVGEVIYFLRNGNLYRRVFLVAPDRAKSITTGAIGAGGGYATPMFGPSTPP